MKTRFLFPLLLVFPAVTASALPKSPLAEEVVEPVLFDWNNPWSPPPPPPDGGGGGLPALYATPPTIVSRAPERLDLSWTTSASDVVGSAIETAPSLDGEFVTQACWSSQLVSSKTGVVANPDCINGPDPERLRVGGLQADTFHCFRTRVWDGMGNEEVSQARCAYTRARTGDDADPFLRPWQARVVVTTGTAPGAATDDPVRVGLNDHLNAITPHGNHTWLDYPHDDFRPGSAFTYDLNVHDLEDLADVTKLSIYKDGEDPWCVSRVEFIVDRNSILERDFSFLPDGCLWLGSANANQSLLEIGHDEMRAEPGWESFVESGPGTLIEASEIQSRVESAVGHLAHYTELYWDQDDDGTDISRVDDQSIHVDTEITASSKWFDPRIRIEFDIQLEVTCEPNPVEGGFDVGLAIIPTDAHVSGEGWLFEVGEFFYCATQGDWNCIEEALNDGIGTGLPESAGGSAWAPFCPQVTIDEFGSIHITP